MNTKKTNHSAGFTLVELMVGIVLSGLFIAGITQVFNSVSKNFRTQRTLSYMMEDARFALDKLNSEIRRTGYLANQELPGGAGADIFPANNIQVDFAFNGGTNVGNYTIRNTPGAGSLFTMQEEFVRGTSNPNGPVSDVVIIRYQLESGNELADNQLSPCTNGFALGGGELATHRHVISIIFYMAFDPDVESNVLYCKAFRENMGFITAPLNITQALNSAPLISNVERIRVLYGVSNGINGTVYMTGDQVTALPAIWAPRWARVRSVRISLALRSEESNLSVNTPVDYILNGKFSVTPNNLGENRLYRVFTTTAAFRN